MVLTLDYSLDEFVLFIITLFFFAELGFHMAYGSFFKCQLVYRVDVIWILAKADEAVVRLIKQEEDDDRQQDYDGVRQGALSKVVLVSEVP